MAVSRSPRPTSGVDDEPVPRPVHRYKVPTTAMVGKTAATYRLVTKKGTTTTRIKKPVAKKVVLKNPATKKTVAKKTGIKKTSVKKIGATTAVVDSAVVGQPSAPQPIVPKSEPTPRKRTAVDRAADPPPATGLALITRVTSAIERELNQIEIIVGGHHVPQHSRSEAERRARTLASLARTLAALSQLRAAHEPKPEGDDDDAMPRDLDAFRDTLARRLDQLIADQSQPIDREPEPG